MNGILFIDVETNGLPAWKLPLTDPCQPHVIQLAAVLTDTSGNVVNQLCTLIRPQGWTIPAEVMKVHGISTERCAQFGMPLFAALDAVHRMEVMADLIVAHNIEFDALLMDCAAARIGQRWRDASTQLYCTAEAATPILKIPPTSRMAAAGITDFKKPKLAECVKHFFGEDHSNAHDAMADVLACMRVYFAIQKLQSPPTEPELFETVVS